MKKLSQAISLIVFIMSSQMFASNIEMSDDDKIQLTRTFIEQGKTDQEIIDFFKAGTVVQKTLSTDVTPTSMPAPAAPSIVVMTPIPSIEETLQNNFVTMATLALPGGDHDIFEGLYSDVRRKIYARTKAGSKDYSIIEWINKIKDERLYNPACWSQFEKKSLFVYDQCDIDMVSSDQQLANIQAIFYIAFYDARQKRITELHAAGSIETRSVQEIINSMSQSTSATISQNVVSTVMYIKNSWFKL